MKKTLYLLPAILFLTIANFASAQSVDEGRKFTRNEQYEDADRVFKSLIAAKPKAGDAYYFSGINFLENGDTNAAAEMFNTGLTMSPKYTLNYVGKGHLLLRAGKSAEAEAMFALALKAKKKALMLANKEVARAYLMVKFGSRETLLANANKAVEFLGKADQVGDNEVQILLGDAYSVISPLDLGRAVEQYQISSRLNANDPKPRLREARVYQKAKNYETSMEKVNEALYLDMDFAPAYRQKAELFSEMGVVYKRKEYRDSAVMFYREYLKRNNNLSARKMFVQSLFFNGEYMDCIEEGAKLQTEKEYPNIWGVMAYAVVQKNDTSRVFNTQGLEYFEKYEMKYVKPANRGLSSTEKYYKGILLLRTGSRDAALSLIKESLTDTANAQIAWYDNYFDLNYKAGNYAEALNAINLKEKKVALISKDMYYKAQCLTQLGKYTESINTFREIISRDTTYTRGYYFISQNWRKIDAKDSTGSLTASYHDWFKHMTADDKVKYKRDLEFSYRDLGYIWYNKASASYVTPADKAAGYVQSKAQFNTAIEYYKKVLEFAPEDAAVKKQIADTENFVANIGKKRAPIKK